MTMAAIRAGLPALAVLPGAGLIRKQHLPSHPAPIPDGSGCVRVVLPESANGATPTVFTPRLMPLRTSKQTSPIRLAACR